MYMYKYMIMYVKYVSLWKNIYIYICKYMQPCVTSYIYLYTNEVAHLQDNAGQFFLPHLWFLPVFGHSLLGATSLHSAKQS